MAHWMKHEIYTRVPKYYSVYTGNEGTHSQDGIRYDNDSVLQAESVDLEIAGIRPGTV